MCQEQNFSSTISVLRHSLVWRARGWPCMQQWCLQLQIVFFAKLHTDFIALVTRSHKWDFYTEMMAFGIQEELNCSSYKGPVQALEEFHSLHWATRPIRLKERHLQVFKEKKVYKWRDRQPHDDSQFFVLGKGRLKKQTGRLNSFSGCWATVSRTQQTDSNQRRHAQSSLMNISQMAHIEAISNGSLSLHLCFWCFLLFVKSTH